MTNDKNPPFSKPRKIIHNQTLIQWLLILCYCLPLALTWAMWATIDKFPWIVPFTLGVDSVALVVIAMIDIIRFKERRKSSR
jgi:hypothetical protein